MKSHHTLPDQSCILMFLSGIHGLLLVLPYKYVNLNTEPRTTELLTQVRDLYDLTPGPS